MQDKWAQYAQPEQSPDKWAQYAQTPTGNNPVGQQEISNQFTPDTAVGGFLNRLYSAGKGLVDLNAEPQGVGETALSLIPGALQLARMGKGQVQAEKTLGPQYKQQVQQAEQSHAGENVLQRTIPNLQDLRAGVTGLSMLNPFASGSVANINQLQDQGKSSTAAGAGTADIAMLLPGLKGSFSPRALTASEVMPILRQALKEKSPEFAGNVQRALPAINDQLAQGKSISSLPSFVDTVRGAKQSVWSQYSQRLASTNQAGAMIDGNKIAQSQINSLPDAITSQIDPGIERQISQTFDVYAGKSFTPSQIEARIQAINNELGSKYAQMGKGVDYSAVARDPYIAPRLAEADALRQSLYDTIDKTSPSPDAAAALKKQYGALTQLEQSALKRQIGVSAQAPFSLSDALNIPSAAAELAFGGPKAALMRLAVNAMIKQRNNPNYLVNKAFSEASPSSVKPAAVGAGLASQTGSNLENQPVPAIGGFPSQ